MHSDPFFARKRGAMRWLVVVSVLVMCCANQIRTPEDAVSQATGVPTTQIQVYHKADMPQEKVYEATVNGMIYRAYCKPVRGKYSCSAKFVGIVDPTPRQPRVEYLLTKQPPIGVGRVLSSSEAEQYRELALSTVMAESKAPREKVASYGPPSIFGDEAVFRVEAPQFIYQVSCGSSGCKIQSSSISAAGQVARALRLKDGVVAEDVEVGEETYLADGYSLYAAKANGKTYRVQCYDDGKNVSCSALEPDEPHYIPTNNIDSGTKSKCSKGCPCGNACIDCSKTCRK